MAAISRKKILITGGSGQLGQVFHEIALNYRSCDFIFTDIEELNICSSDAIDSFFAQNKPDVLINCAAYTAVDLAEDEKDLAFNINAQAVLNLAQACDKNNCFFVHFSTDYVFDGNSCLAYSEEASCNPKSIYGASKLQGEEYIQTNPCKSLIIRTSWLYAHRGKNFVNTMLKLAESRSQLQVVSDQIGSPTFALDLAQASLEFIENTEIISKKEILHYSNEGIASWYDFAYQIMLFSGKKCLVLPVNSDQYPCKAPRPIFSLLNKSKAQSILAKPIPHWTQSLENCLKLIDEQP